MTQPTTHPAPPAAGPHAAPPYGAGPYVPIPCAPAPPPRRSSVGRTIGIVVGSVATAVILFFCGLIALGAWYGPSRLDQGELHAAIIRSTQGPTGLVATDIQCPDVLRRADVVAICTARLDGQPITYTVRQDDQGHVTVESSTFVELDHLEQVLAAEYRQDLGDPTTVDCAGDRQLVVGGRGTTFPCTVTDTVNPSKSQLITATITDDDGTVGVR